MFTTCLLGTESKAQGLELPGVLDFLTGLLNAGTVSEDQVRCLVERAEVLENHYDPYYELGEPANPWAERPWAKKVWLLNEYTVAQQYGGPEEGGWWYDEKTPTGKIAGVFLDKDDAYESARHLNVFAREPWPRHRSSFDPMPNDWIPESHIPRFPAGRPQYC